MFKPVLPQKTRRGGARPGAGAPKGNTNALKHGAYSERVYRGLLIIALVPEVRMIFQALRRGVIGVPNPSRRDALLHRRILGEAVSAAFDAAPSDPELARTIRALIGKRLQEAATRIEEELRRRENRGKQIQSNAAEGVSTGSGATSP